MGDERFHKRTSASVAPRGDQVTAMNQNYKSV